MHGIMSACMCLQTRDILRLSLLETKYSTIHTCSSAGRAKKYGVVWSGSLTLPLDGVELTLLLDAETLPLDAEALPLDAKTLPLDAEALLLDGVEAAIMSRLWP